MVLSFTYFYLFAQGNIAENTLVCNVSSQILVVGDLKFCAQLLGRESMSS
jgi:accessory gene regulator protein AgrB